MKNFAIRIKDGKPDCLVSENTDFYNIDSFVRFVLELPEVAVDAAQKAAKQALGYQKDWNNICGQESNRALPTDDFWHTEEDITLAYLRITAALQSAEEAGRNFLSKILPDGDYITTWRLTRI